MSLPPASVTEARELVDRILSDNGWVSKEDLDKIESPSLREKFERAFRKKDEKIGASALTLSKNIYASSARFVFELLQNTDDNNYSTALEAGQDPFVSFRLYHDRLVVDCNENGFTNANLTAICDIGKSSKSKHEGYIGEKGIGFKSVFMAAWKVHIQSGFLSFYFEHKEGYSGMGMVQPIWEDPTEELPQANYTRITLLLHQSKNGKGLDKIREQFKKLEPAVLLFVRRLRRIDITLYDEDGRQESATRLTRRSASEANCVVLNKHLIQGSTEPLDSVTPERHIYHVTRHLATNVARHDHRELTDAEEANPSSCQSEIVLAFPISAHFEPVIEPQKMFAFLPMKQMGFNFLIQADFVTEANRENIVEESDRNKDLRNGVIDALMSSIQQFCEHETLRYTWMRYLPCDGTHHWDTFWKELVDGIKVRLQEEEVIESRGSGVLRRIREMRRPARDTYDRYGDPLFPDLDPDVYISDGYQDRDLTTLKIFGLPMLSFREVIQTVWRDLDGSAGLSRFQSYSADDDWHTRAAMLLRLAWVNDWDDRKNEIRQLPIIPLTDGSWVNAEDGDIFYASIGDIPIPKDLMLRTVDPRSTKNAKRLALFGSMGVKHASISRVRSRISSLYAQAKLEDINFHDSMEHLKFLYLTHQSRSEEEVQPVLHIYNHLGRQLRPSGLYIQDDHPYGAERLLATGVVPFINTSFVSKQYFEEVPPVPSGSSLSWLQWMYDYVGVRRDIPLLNVAKDSLSSECKHIAKHQGISFLGFLKHVWPEQGGGVVDNENILAELKAITITCKNGIEVPLSACYLPLQELQNLELRFTKHALLPFLEIELSDDASLLSEWSFLTDVIGVRSRNDLEFRLDLLERCASYHGASPMPCDLPGLLDLYLSIEAFCMDSKNTQSMRDRVYNFIQEKWLILNPAPNAAGWAARGVCLWEAPVDFMFKIPLKEIYEEADIGVDRDGIRQFFQGTLRIPNVTHQDVTNEIWEMQGVDEQIGRIRSLYGMLQEMHQNDPSIADDLRDTFESKSLVYVEKRGSSDWYSPSQCLWSSATSIDGKVAINDHYTDFEHLFRDVLEVPSLNLTMIHEKLLSGISSGSTTERVKDLLLNFSSLLPREANPPTPGRLRQRRIFPIKPPGGRNTTLGTSETEFFIVDRDDLFTAFGDRVQCFDFSLKDVCRLRPFIDWARLESRYLSRCVEEVSKVRGGTEWPIRESKRDIKNKAYGLLRVASKCESPRFKANPQAFYDLLRNGETVEAEGISSTLVLRQNGRVYEHQVSESDLHIEEKDKNLKIYVPHDDGAWDSCFNYTLPLRLLSWIMAPPGSSEAPVDNCPESAVFAIAGVLNCILAAVPTILEKNGVPDIEEVDERPLPSLDSADLPVTPPQGGHASGVPPQSPDTLSSAAITPGLLSPPEDGGASYVTPLTDPGYYDPDSHVVASPPAGLLFRAGLEEEVGAAFRKLLGSAATMSGRVARRDYGATDVTDALDNLSLRDDDVFNNTFSTYDILSRARQYTRIGAAGELFVFELLSKLLPSFGRGNWQSTIRYLATDHPRYGDLTDWNGTETSDIVYEASSSALTDLLINKGYLSDEQWGGATPKYYIEVKSTLDRCSAPFYVTHGQADRMMRTTNGPSGSENQHAIYAIFRVFNLGMETTGLRIYVDPHEQRRTGKLNFESRASYTVTPGLGA